MRSIGLALLALLLATAPAAAHKLKVFAAAVGAEIEGRVYFVGGGAATGVPVTLRDSRDAIVATATTTPPDGRFVLPLAYRDDYLVTADAQDGHVASFRLAATELSTDLPPPPGGPTPTEQPAPAPQAVSEPAAITDSAAIETIVARQLAPLAEEIDALRDNLGLRDIIGGIGYIVGAFGLWAFVLSRRRK